MLGSGPAATRPETQGFPTLRLLVFLLLALSLKGHVLLPAAGPVDLEVIPVETAGETDPSLSLEQAMALEYRSMENRRSMGFTKKAVWVRVEVSNPRSEELRLYLKQLDGYLINRLTFYETKEGRLLRQEENGPNIPVAAKSHPDSAAVFPFSLAPGESKTIYVRFQTPTPMLVSLALEDPTAYLNHRVEKNLVYGLLFGALTAMALYNLFLYVSLDRREYLYYVLYLLCAQVVTAAQTGFVVEHLGLDGHQRTGLFHSVYGAAIFLLLFSKTVLETAARMPGWNRGIHLFLGMNLFAGIMGIVFTVEATMSYLTALVFATSVFLLAVGAAATVKRIPTGRFFLFTTGIFLLSVIVVSSLFFGLLPYNFLTRNAYYMGIVAEALLLSLLLSYRFNLLRREKIGAQQALLRAERQAKRELEEKVRERTGELEELNRTLEKRIRKEVEQNREKDRFLAVKERRARLGEMIDIILHQWKQPLNLIALRSMNLHAKAEKGDPNADYVRSAALEIEGQVHFMSDTSNNLRNFFREDKEADLFSPCRSVREFLDLFREIYRRDGVRIDLEGEEKLMVRGVENQFKQVILSLCGNAKEIFDERKVKNPAIRIAVAEEGPTVVVTVADNGGGVEPQFLPFLFDHSFTTRRARGGTGIGLFLVKSVMEEMGGSVACENRDGGASFTLRLPKA